MNYSDNESLLSFSPFTKQFKDFDEEIFGTYQEDNNS